MSRIQLTIDRVVLKGLAAGQEKAFVENLREQLTQMLADRASRKDWALPHRTPVLKLGKVPLQAGASGGRTLGAAVGRSIGRGLKP
jgi:hypothetical protein